MRRRIRTLLAVFVAVAMMVLALAGLLVTSSSPAGAAVDPEADMFSRTNQARAAQGLGALQWDAATANIARSWSQSMAGARTLSHNGNLASQITNQVTNQWTRIGENVGFGPDTASLQSAFMNSSPHRANIMGDYNRVGVGAAYDSNGTLWITLDFVKGPDLGPPPNAPRGSIDSVTATPGVVKVAGWALDPDTTASIDVHLYLDNTGFILGPANQSRPDVANAFPGFGDQHGYSTGVPSTSGWHRACLYALNVGSSAPNALLGCVSVFVPDASPFGSLDSVRSSFNQVSVSGWTIDPDTANSVQVHLYVDNTGFILGPANQSRSDVGNAFPGYGANHGYSTGVPVTPGGHTACAYAINVGGGSNRLLGCASIVVPDSSPFGSLDSVTNTGSGIAVSGWAVDPDTANPIQVHLYVDNTGFILGPANQSRPDVGNAFPGYGANHGYSTGVPVTRGWHTACAYAINVGGGSNRLLGCRSVNVG